MEQKYWEQFMKSGDVSDYLGYKMEVYGHSGGRYSNAGGAQYGAKSDDNTFRQNERTGQGRIS